MRTRTQLAALGLAVGVITSTAAIATGPESDGVELRADFPSGGSARLELEDRNVERMICFVWESPAPQDGDSFSSRVLTRDGREVLYLGTADQWVDGTGQGCQVTADDRYARVFADPGDHVVEFHVVEEQSTPPAPPVVSGPLRADSS